VEALISECRTGPRAAKVDRIEVEVVEGKGPCRFEVAATV
jgi:hypothetical protein